MLLCLLPAVFFVCVRSAVFCCYFCFFVCFCAIIFCFSHNMRLDLLVLHTDINFVILVVAISVGVLSSYKEVAIIEARTAVHGLLLFFCFCVGHMTLASLHSALLLLCLCSEPLHQWVPRQNWNLK